MSEMIQLYAKELERLDEAIRNFELTKDNVNDFNWLVERRDTLTLRWFTREKEMDRKYLSRQ